MKRVLFIVLGIVVLGVIGVAVAIMRLDAQALRSQVAEVVRSATGKPLIIQDIPKISFMPLGIKFGAASWGNAADGKADPADDIFVAVKNGQISLQFIPLLSGKILIDEVRLDSPDVRLRMEKGVPAQKTVPPGTEDSKTLPASKAAPASPIPPQLEINRLRLTNASIRLEMNAKQTIQLSRFNMELDDLKVGAEMRLEFSSDLAVSEPALEGAIALKAKARLQTRNYELRDVAMRFTPAKGIIPPSTGAIDLALQANYALDSGRLGLGVLKLAAQGSKVEISGDANAGSLAFNGRFKIDSAPRKLAQALGLKLPFKKGLESFTLQSSLDMAGQTLTLGSIHGMLDTTAIDGKLSLELNKMHVAGNLNLGTLNLDALMASAPLLPVSLNNALTALIGPGEAHAATPRKAPAKAAQPAPSTSQSAPPGKTSAVASSALPSVNMELACASLTASKLQFKDIRAKIRGRGLYHIEPLTLSMGTGGTVNLNISVDAAAMRYTAAGKINNVAVGPLLQALQGKRPADGTANLDLDNIACAGTTSKAIQSSLSGKGMLTVRGIVLNDVSILPKDAPAGLGKPPTHFEQLTAPFTASAGIVNLAPVVLTSPAAGLKGQGVVRLPQENMHFTADVSLLKTATIPIQVSGPFSSLSYGLDGKRALQMLTQTPGALMDTATGLGGKVTRQGGNIGQKAGDAARGAKNMLKGVFRP